MRSLLLLFIMLRLPVSAQNPRYCGNYYAPDWSCDVPDPNQPGCHVCTWTDPVYGAESCDYACYQNGASIMYTPVHMIAGMNTTASPRLMGLPDLKISLERDADHADLPHEPAVVNNSTRGVLGYVLMVTDDSGITNDMSSIAAYTESIAKNSHEKAGILPGTWAASSSGIRPVHHDGSPMSVSSVALDSVVFSDGEVAGPDKAGLFHVISVRLKAVREFGLAALADPTQIEAVAKANRAALRNPRTGTADEMHAWEAAGFAAEQVYQIQLESGLETAIDAARNLSRIPEIRRGEQK